MRRLYSLTLVIAMLLCILPGSALAVPPAPGALVATSAELSAALADDSVDSIALTADILTSAQLSVTRPVTIDGQGHTITVETDLGTVNGSKHALGIEAGTEASPTVISNVTIDSAYKAYGVNVFGGVRVQMSDVTLKNSKGAGLTVNGSSVSASGLVTSGNRWGAVNVDPGSGVTTPSSFTLLSGTLGESNKIWSDGSNVTDQATVSVSAAGAGFEAVPTGTKLSLWTVPRTIAVANSAELIAAIRDLQPSDTLVLAPGVYDVERVLGDLSFGGQTGWYLPIGKPGVTLRGAGPGLTTLTSSVNSANGVWASQDLISVWANSVTIEGVKIVPKAETNKAIEVMGKDFTLRNVEFATNPAGPEIGGEFYEFAGSLYFNPQTSVTAKAGDVGNSRVENVLIESAWLAAPVSSVTTGSIVLRDVTLDWVGAGYAPYGYGMMSANPVITVERDVLFIVDGTMSSISVQASSRLPVGGELRIVGMDTLPGDVFTGLKRGGAFPAAGDLTINGDGFSWNFPVGTLDPSFSETFYPGVSIKTTPSSPVSFGAMGVRLLFDNVGNLPGPGTLRILVGTPYAGKTFVDAFLGSSAGTFVVGQDGYLTVPVSERSGMSLIELRRFPVTFESNGAAPVASQSVLAGSEIAEPAAPFKAGYTFAGWFADSAFLKPWDFSADFVTGQTTLYAKFNRLPNASVGNPVAPRTMTRGRYYTVTGSLKPRHTAGTSPVRIYRYRYVGGKWKSYGYVNAKVVNRLSYSKYTKRMSLPAAGRWRLRAYAPTDAQHFGTWSAGADYVTVR